MAKKKKEEVPEIQTDVELNAASSKKTLIEILKGATTSKDVKEIYEDAIVDLQDESEVATDFISTNVAIINLAFSSRIKLRDENGVITDGGIPIGKTTLISTPSMFGKSFIAMYIIRNAQKKGLNVVYLDAEDSFSHETAKQLKIDLSPERFTLVVENSLEKLRTIVITMINEIPKNDRKNFLFVLDSWNVLYSAKSFNDALSGDDKADFSLTKKKNDFANLILGSRATFFILNHVYDDVTSMYGGVKIPGGRRIIHNAQCSLLGKSVAKDEDSKGNLLGQVVTARVHKSRYGKNNIDIKYRINIDGGLDPFYGLLPDAVNGGYVVKEGNKYTRPCVANDKTWWEKDCYSSEFWSPIFLDTDFYKWIATQYQHSEELDVVTEEELISNLI